MKKYGFTLVEVMVVVAIIAFLAAIAIPNLIRARTQANESSAQSTLKSIATALENYYALNNAYPLTTSVLLGASPPYLNVDYFNGAHNGYTYSNSLAAYTYVITAAPTSSSSGTHSYTISTGAVLTAY